ncbi:conserved hypothetical protein [Hyphomicrobiales bacterium]|nr:conserved hypothetical protein [Hyphomicrobiales bacterium]CAH1696202.1 conserved hypothetical protein [Hyphomicrobiales bacterium]
MKRIAVVKGSPSSVIQNLLRELAERWQSDIRIAGVVEEPHGLADRKCNAGYLRSIASGTLYPIFQDLGRGAEACHLEGAGAISATEAIEQDIAAGCDLVMLSKFGKLEASREGLSGAFAAAIDAGLPVLTSVSPAFEQAWEKFAAPLFHVLPADPNEIDAWRRAIFDGAAAGRRLQA